MVVADDSVLLREGLVRLLTEVDCQVVAAVEDAPGFLRAVSEQRPDVAIVDVRMPPGMTDDGLRAAVEARESQPGLGILMLSAYVELSYADDCSPTDAVAWDICLKIGSPPWTLWLMRSGRFRRVAPFSIPRSSRSSWWRAAAPTP